MIIATILTVLFVIQERRGREFAYLFENLDDKLFPLASVYTVGYAWSMKGPIRMKGDIASEYKIQAGMLFEPQYADFYASVVWSQIIALTHLFLTVTFLLAGFLYSMHGMILFLGLAISVACVLNFGTQMKNVLKSRTAECEMLLPEVVSTMAILVNSGMVLKDAWELIAENGEGAFYDLMKVASENMKNGYSDADAIFLFGKTSNSSEIKKFVSALLQSMEKGGSELSMFLANQSSELWKLKRQHMLQEGEKAATKLLAPIVLIFGGILIIVITAAVAGVLF